ncbi:MAG: NAD-binding protein [Enterocloster asparagiformis]|nr:NAD-binding protein [Enterocloster asparagiformis]
MWNRKKTIIIAGCSRFGAGLAGELSENGGDVIIIDKDDDAFRKLPPNFSGFQIVGNVTDPDLLEDAGIKRPCQQVVVHGDRELLELAVSNALDNALIHTPENEKVYISLGQEQGYGVLEVSDSGSGISFQELQWTLKGDPKRCGGPSGGLSVSKRIMDRNQGNLVIKSSRYGGTTVILSLKAVAG